VLAIAGVILTEQPYTLLADCIFCQEGNVIKELGVSKERVRIKTDTGEEVAVIWHLFAGKPDGFDHGGPGVHPAFAKRPCHFRGEPPLFAPHVPAFQPLCKWKQDQRACEAPYAVEQDSVQHWSLDICWALQGQPEAFVPQEDTLRSMAAL